MASIEVFTEEEDELLITLVSQHPILYDLRREDYKNNRKKDQVWSQIAEQLNKRSDSCKKHWKNLKDTYLRQKRKNKSGTGSAAPKNPRSKITLYTRMFSFLDTVSSERPTISNISDDVNTQESGNGQMFSQPGSSHTQTQLDDLAEYNRTGNSPTTTPPETPSPPPPPPGVAVSQDAHPSSVKFPNSNKKRTKKDDILTYLQKRENSRQSLLENISKKKEDDELASFAEHIKQVLKKMTPILKLKAKKEIFDILIKYEFLQVESDTDSDRPSTSTSHVSSIHTGDNTTPEPQAALIISKSQHGFVAYSPVSQVTIEEVEPGDALVTTDNTPLYSVLNLQEQEPTDLSQFNRPEGFYDY